MTKTPQEKLHAIPTNIVTGFLGVGKTTAISYLLSQKPANERWAILVNEFGEVGIDGSLYNGQKTSDKQIFIGEVPGGCMCCTASGVPMQIALTQLLRQARPDRLLIEPTGLGHSKEVMRILTSPQYKDVLRLRATITLVDARKITDERYTKNGAFNQQLKIADIIVANKADLYRPQDLDLLQEYLTNLCGDRDQTLHTTTQGVLKIDWLEKPAKQLMRAPTSSSQPLAQSPEASPSPSKNRFQFPEKGFLSFANKGEGFHTQGWVFKPDLVFDAEKVNALIQDIQAERLKGVFITPKGILGFNKTEDVSTRTWIDEAVDSRIEIIADGTSVFDGLESRLLACLGQQIPHNS